MNNKKSLKEHKNETIRNLKSFIDDLDDKKASIFCYWLDEYIKYLKHEYIFAPQKLRTYKRGEIIKANLGFNVGSEEGGLHYCIVLDNNNSNNSPTITVAPLTSLKKGKNSFYPSELYIDNELFNLLKVKIETKSESLVQSLKTLESNRHTSNIHSEIKRLKEELKQLKKIMKEISSLKHGSIVLLNQITTISKIRIYDPKRNDDPLAKIKLSNPTLDKIDSKIKELYTKNI